MSNDTRSILQQKADAFCLLGKLVHITYKQNSQWKNGVIKKIYADYFMLDERLQGEILVFFDEINDIREYTEILK